MAAMCKVVDSFGLRRRHFALVRNFKRPLIKEMAVLSKPLQLTETDAGANIIEGEITFVIEQGQQIKDLRPDDVCTRTFTSSPKSCSL